MEKAHKAKEKLCFTAELTAMSSSHYAQGGYSGFEVTGMIEGFFCF